MSDGLDAMRGRVGTDPRIRRRRRAVERARRKRIIWWAIAAAVVAAVVYGALFSPLLDVRKVQVLGSSHVSPQDVVAVTRLGEDDNLLLTSISRVARRVELLPWVKRAKVSRRLPGTIRVRIEERNPALLLKTTGGAATVDGRGRVLSREPAGKGLPSLSGSAAPAPAPGEVLREPELRAALKVWRGLPRRLKGRIEAIFAPTIERISLALEDGTIVRYGAPESIDAKNSVLGALLPRSGGAAYVDVRVPTSPAVGPAAPAIEPTPVN